MMNACTSIGFCSARDEVVEGPPVLEIKTSYYKATQYSSEDSSLLVEEVEVEEGRVGVKGWSVRKERDPAPNSGLLLLDYKNLTFRDLPSSASTGVQFASVPGRGLPASSETSENEVPHTTVFRFGPKSSILNGHVLQYSVLMSLLFYATNSVLEARI
jgi:hypothetical protein